MLYGLIKAIVQEVLKTSILVQEGLFNSMLRNNVILVLQQ